MPKSQQTEEVRILRFFEEAPLEQAEMLFNIVKEKMRCRMGTNGKANEPQKRKAHHVMPDKEAKNTGLRGISNEALSHEKS
jgi:hypothetical protein